MPHASRVAYRYLIAKSLGRGETLERNDYRIHRFADSLRLTDLTNAGKRGKKVQQLWVTWWRGNMEEGPLLEHLQNWFEFATRARSYKAMAATIETGLSELASDGVSIESGYNTLRGVDVTPAGFSDIEIHTADIYLKAEHNSFVVKDMKDRANEPTCYARGKKSILVFYRWVKDNEQAIKRMTFREVLKGMEGAGVQYNQYCAMD